MQSWRHREAAVLAPAALILLAQVGLFIWMAPRAFEFTDEAYYLLNLLHWREMQGNVTFFGAYFELPFRVLGQGIASIRLFSLALLLACSAYAALAVRQYLSTHGGGRGLAPPSSFVVVGMAGSMLYFSILSTLRVPSYNLGALCAALVSTGALLGLLSAGGSARGKTWSMLAYGVALGACGLNKATAGLAVSLLHAVFVVAVGRPWLRDNWVRFVSLSVFGIALNLIPLTFAAPHWLAQLKEGVALVSTTDGRGPLSLLTSARWDLQRIFDQHWAWAAIGGLVYVGGCLAAHRMRVQPNGLAGVLLTVVGATALSSSASSSLWWPVIALVVLLQVIGTVWGPRDPRGQDALVKRIGLVTLLTALPLALSFGTNMPLMAHARTNAVFAVLALLAVLTLCRGDGGLSRVAAGTAFAALCLPGLIYQWAAASSAEHSYRQLRPLAEQDVPVSLGSTGTTLLVDAETAKGLQAVRGAMLAAGWTEGAPLLDFTGDGPGWVYAMGGTPVGVPWLLGGYPGSEKTAARLIEGQPQDLLRRSWLLTSDSNPRRIRKWREFLDSRLGETTHDKFGTVSVPAHYSWEPHAPDRFDLQIWRPRSR